MPFRVGCPTLLHSMMHVVGLRAPDRGVAEARFRARLAPPATGAAAGEARDRRSENDRGVRLAMELVHSEDFGVAEEANEVIR